MRIRYSNFITIICLSSLFSCGYSRGAEEVIRVLESFRGEMQLENWEAAGCLLSENTINFLDRATVELERLGLRQLERGPRLFKGLVENSRLNLGQDDPLSVYIEGETAYVSLSQGSFPETVVFMKENGQWRVNLEGLLTEQLLLDFEGSALDLENVLNND